MKYSIDSFMLIGLVCVFPAAAQVGGSGTAHRVPLWTSATNLGDSVLTQSSGNVGVGNATPAAALDVQGKAGTVNTNGGAAPTAARIVGGSGAGNATGFGTQGAGGPIQFASGNGAPLPAGLASGGTGAILLVTGGTGATCFAASTRCSSYKGGNGGSISLQPGSGGKGLSSSGVFGSISLAPNGGKVGVGTSNPSVAFEVGAGKLTLADAWTTRSSLRFKTNIQPLADALEKVERLHGVSYDRKVDGKHEIGLVAEEANQVVPELVSVNPETSLIEGLDYSRLTVLLIEAIKSQQSQIQQLKLQISELQRESSTKD
jgi:Chaperone of endosialidase